MALTDNPIVKSLMDRTQKPLTQPVPQGQAPVAPQGQAPVAPGLTQPTPASAPQAPTAAQIQQYGHSMRPGSPNRGMNPLEEKDTNNEYNPMGYNPIPLYDDGGDVNTQDSPGTLKRLGDKAKGLVSSVKALPPNSGEVQSIEDKQAQVNTMAAQNTPKAKPELKPIVPAESDLVHPAPYGERPGSGQVLYSIDNDGNLTPVKVAPPAPPAPATHQTAAPVEQEQPHMKPIVPESLKAPMPVYDEGGDVNVNDGKHQLAILQDGEKVLTPDKADQYNAEHPEEKSEPTTVADNKALKPYSQVVEEKAKQKAAEQVNNPGVHTSTVDNAAPEPLQEKPVEEKPKPTLGGVLAEGWAKRVMPNLVNNLVKPEAMGGAPASTPAAEPAPPAAQPGMKPIVPAPVDHKTKVEQYNKAIQAALDEGTADGHERALLLKEAKLNYENSTPWGSPTNHPGILGKLGHAASIAGQAGLAAIVPGANALIPGTIANRNIESEETEKLLPEAIKANAAEANSDKTSLAGYKQVSGGAVDPKAEGELKGVPQVAFVNSKNPNDIIYRGPLTPKTTASSDKTAFQSVLKKVGTADVADPAQQKQAIETAHNAQVISDDEYKGAMAYLGSTSNAPATQVASAEEKRMAGKTMYYNTPTGRKAYTAAEAKANGFNPADGVVENESQVAKDREKNSTYRVIQSALSKYQKNIETSQLTPNDITTMTTITEDAEKPDYISKLISGVFDDVLGHPVTGYSEKLMKGTLTKNQYQDLSPAARQLVADYYTTMMAHFANMKAAQGTIPRNPVIIQTEMHTIPKPFLSGEEAKPAFQNYLDTVAMRNSDNVDFGGATGAPKAPEVTAPTGATDEVVKDGKVIGHVVTVNGKKVYQALQQ